MIVSAYCAVLGQFWNYFTAWIIRTWTDRRAQYSHTTTYEHHETYHILSTYSYKDNKVITHAYKSCTVKRQAKIKQRIVQKYGSFCYRATKVYLPLKVEIFKSCIAKGEEEVTQISLN